MPQLKTTDKKPKTKNNEFEFTKLTDHQNDEPNQNLSKPNWHQAKRASAGFFCQIQNMPCKRDVLSKLNLPIWVLCFDLLVCANAGVKPRRVAPSA